MPELAPPRASPSASVPNNSGSFGLHLRRYIPCTHRATPQRSRMLLWIRLQRSAEALYIRKAKFFHNRQHLSFITFHRIKADLVDLLGRLVQRRALPDPEGIVGVAVRKRPDARVLSGLRNIFAPSEIPQIVGTTAAHRPKWPAASRSRSASGPPHVPTWGTSSAAAQTDYPPASGSASVSVCTRTFSSRYCGGTRPSSMPSCMFVMICEKAVGTFFSRADIVVVVLHGVELQISPPAAARSV